MPATPTAVQQPQPTLTQEDADLIQTIITEAAQAEHLQVTTEGIAGPGVSHLDNFTRGRMVKVILKMCAGQKWSQISQEEGVTWALLQAWCRTKALRALSNAAQEYRNKVKFAEILEAAQEEAANDDVDPVIGRIGKDLDGIVKDDQGKPITKRRHNTKMRELFLKAHDPRFRDSGSEQDKGAGSRPIVYNIAFIGGPAAAVALQQAKPAIEATFEDVKGGNQAAKSPFV
jgi:hypothetical protein